MLASNGKTSMLRPETGAAVLFGAPGPPSTTSWPEPGQASRKYSFESIASSIRKGNVIEQDGKLYVVPTAENIHPGKGTPGPDRNAPNLMG